MNLLETAEKEYMGNSLALQWLGLGAFTAVCLGSIPGWGTKISQATRCSQKKKEYMNAHVKQKLVEQRGYYFPRGSA